MVLPPQKMPQDIADKAAAEQIKRMVAEGKNVETVHRMLMRQWAVERAVQVCGQDGVVWVGDPSREPKPDQYHAPYMRSAVVPIAKEIFAFVMGEDDNPKVL